MGRRCIAPARDLLLGVSLLLLLSSRFAGASDTLKANLDLPFDAVGSTEEEELAPEVVFFYGQAYESDAMAFALDESGSMQDNGRWAIQTREVVAAISQLSERAEFGVVYYGSRVTALGERPQAATAPAKAAAIGFVTARRPQGDTCLFEGVIKALEIVRRSSSKHRAVIVTSDGRPDNCSTGNRATAQEVEMYIQRTLGANPGRAVKVHTIWVGSGTDREAIMFMQRLAEAHGGSFKVVSR